MRVHRVFLLQYFVQLVVEHILFKIPSWVFLLEPYYFLQSSAEFYNQSEVGRVKILCRQCLQVLHTSWIDASKENSPAEPLCIKFYLTQETYIRYYSNP